MLDTLDARLAQARNGELGHLDFLQVLCHDEVARLATASNTEANTLAPNRLQACVTALEWAATRPRPSTPTGPTTR